jgi:hypothetical protein
MKLSSWKIAGSIGFVLCCFVVGGIILFRQKRTPVQPQPKRYPHEHLQTSALEPSTELQTVDYTVRDGETLAGIAKRRYGHQSYYSVIKLYNHLEDERQIAADYKLRLPEMSVILAEEGFTRLAPQEAALILCSRAKYNKALKQLSALPTQRGVYQIPEDSKRELLEAADDLQQASESLKQARQGVTRVPEHMIGQLEQNRAGMRDLAEGHRDDYGYDIDLVQQRYALALAYAIIWTRESLSPWLINLQQLPQ